MAKEAGGILNVGKGRLREVALQGRRRIGDEVAFLGAWVHVDAPALFGQRHHDHRRDLEEDRSHVVLAVPARHGRVEDCPRSGQGLAGEVDPGLLANDAVQAVAADQPVRLDLDGLAVALERRGNSVGALDEAGEPGGARHRPVDRLEEIGQDPLRGLLRDAEVEWVAGFVEREVEHAEHLAVRFEAGAPHAGAAVEDPIGQPEGLEDLDRAAVDHRRPIPAARRVEGVDQEAIDAAAPQLDRQQQAGRPGAADQHRSPRGSVRSSPFDRHPGPSLHSLV